MNFGQLKEAVKRQFGDEASVQITDDDIIRWLEFAQDEIVRENEEILNTIVKQNIVSGQDEYAFPTDALTVRSMRAFNNSDSTVYVPIMFLTNAQFEKSIAGWESLNLNFQSPYIWTSYDETIYLFPSPTENITNGLRISYAKKPTLPSLDADPLGLPLEYHNSILQYCLVQAYEMDENWEASGNKFAQLQSSLNRRANRLQSEARETYPKVTVMPEDM